MTEEAIEAQIALVKRMRQVVATLPKWVSQETILTVQSTDAECIRLKQRADELWGVA